MKVFIVTSDNRICGVYDSKDKAIKVAKEAENSGYYPKLVIQEQEVG